MAVASTLVTNCKYFELKGEDGSVGYVVEVEYIEDPAKPYELTVETTIVTPEHWGDEMVLEASRAK